MLPPSPGRAESHGFEYKRNGTLSLFAALNTATGEVIGKTAPRHTSEQFVAFLTDVVAMYCIESGNLRSIKHIVIGHPRQLAIESHRRESPAASCSDTLRPKIEAIRRCWPPAGWSQTMKRASTKKSDGAVVRATSSLEPADVLKHLHFNPAEGLIWLEDRRMVLLHVESLGALRQEFVLGVGMGLFTALSAQTLRVNVNSPCAGRICATTPSRTQ